MLWLNCSLWGFELCVLFFYVHCFFAMFFECTHVRHITSHRQPQRKKDDGEIVLFSMFCALKVDLFQSIFRLFIRFHRLHSISLVTSVFAAVRFLPISFLFLCFIGISSYFSCSETNRIFMHSISNIRPKQAHTVSSKHAIEYISPNITATAAIVVVALKCLFARGVK